jgi:nucleotide-binding universal stress UspA family protein
MLAVMQWLVGLDLAPSSRGAIVFAQWLAERARESDRPDSLRAVHIVERALMGPLFGTNSPDNIIEEARKQARTSLDAVEASEAFSKVHVGLDTRADEGLRREAAIFEPDAVIVGRKARKDATEVFRLGPTAHRLLRTLPAPVIVVPNDLTRTALGPGPILAATDLESHSVAACRFAQKLGAHLGREVAYCHVVSDPRATLDRYFSRKAVGELAEQAMTIGERMTSAWLDVEDLAGPKVHLVQGNAVDGLCETAIAMQAPLIVLGSRRLSGLERVFVGSTSTDLARVSPCPIAVIPPDAL